MKVVDIAVDRLLPALWNPNMLGTEMAQKLRNSLEKYGQVENLVVRPVGSGMYEVIGGNHRLRILTDSGVSLAPCVVVDVTDSDARLLAQALNRVQGEDDIGLKAELLRDILGSMTREEALSILPESAATLRELETLGQDDLADQLKRWEAARSARLRNVTLSFSEAQLEVFERAVSMARRSMSGRADNPNARSNAVFEICASYVSERRAQ